MRSSRRHFLRIALAGGAALLTGSVGTLARAATKKTSSHAAPHTKPAPVHTAAPAATAAPARPADVEKEIASQKKSLAGQLATIRKFELPPGSNPAYVFRAIAPRREGTR